MPAFKDHGRILVYYAAFADHYSVYPASTAIVEALGDELKPYITGKGTLRFDAHKPIPSRSSRRSSRPGSGERGPATSMMNPDQVAPYEGRDAHDSGQEPESDERRRRRPIGSGRRCRSHVEERRRVAQPVVESTTAANVSTRNDETTSPYATSIAPRGHRP